MKENVVRQHWESLLSQYRLLLFLPPQTRLLAPSVEEAFTEAMRDELPSPRGLLAGPRPPSL